MSTWTQVNDRGDVPVDTAVEIVWPGFEGARVKTTAAQTVNAAGIGYDEITWHSDSASGCFNVGALWSAGDPKKIIVPAATESYEFYLASYQIKFAIEDYAAGITTSVLSSNNMCI